MTVTFMAYAPISSEAHHGQQVVPPEEIITITVTEADRAGRYSVHHGDRYLLTSASPFLDAARVLVAQGHDPQATLVMRRSSLERIDLSGPLGIAAGLVVEGTSFRPYRNDHRKAGP